MKEAFAILKELRELEWPSKWGGIVYALGIFLLVSILLGILTQVGVIFSSVWVIYILSGAQIIHIVAWFIKRNYFYDPSAMTVAFAVATEESSREYYREIKKKFREQVATHQLQGDVKIKELPTDVTFSDSNVAEAFIIKKGIRLLVWGNTTEGNLANAPFSQFNIKLSYQHGVIDKEKQKKFVDEIGVATQRGMWGIRHPESFVHLIVVSGNILEISLYTLGACLATVPNIAYLLKSVDIFEKLQGILEKRNQDTNFPNLRLVKQKVKAFLGDAYGFLMMFYWNNLKNLDQAMTYSEKAIKIDENNFNAHQNMAVFQWLKGDREKARFHTERAWRIRPDHPLPRFNKAFFFIYNRNYEQGLKQYKKIKYVGNTNVIDVIEFVAKEFEKFQDNLGLLFIAGWLNFNYADQIRGAAQLKEFIQKAESDQSYAILFTEAQRIITNPSLNN